MNDLTTAGMLNFLTLTVSLEAPPFHHIMLVEDFISNLLIPRCRLKDVCGEHRLSVNNGEVFQNLLTFKLYLISSCYLLVTWSTKDLRVLCCIYQLKWCWISGLDFQSSPTDHMYLISSTCLKLCLIKSTA